MFLSYDMIMGGSIFSRSCEQDVLLEYCTPDHTGDIWLTYSCYIPWIWHVICLHSYIYLVYSDIFQEYDKINSSIYNIFLVYSTYQDFHLCWEKKLSVTVHATLLYDPWIKSISLQKEFFCEYARTRTLLSSMTSGVFYHYTIVPWLILHLQRQYYIQQ